MPLSSYFQPRVRPVLQGEGRDCGPACIATIAKMHGRAIPLAAVRAACPPDIQGVSLFSLSETAEAVGLSAMAVRVRPKDLLAKAPLPCVVHIDEQHFVVVVRADPRRVWIADPAVGLVAVSPEDFGQRTTRSGPECAALLLRPREEFFRPETARTLTDGEGPPPPGYFARVRPYLSGLGQYGTSLVVGVAALALIQLAFPFLMRSVVDIGIADSDLSFVAVALGAYLFLVFTRYGVEFLQGWMLLHVGVRVNIGIVSDFLATIMRLPLPEFGRRSVADLLQRITEQGRVQTLITNTALTAVSAVLTLVVFGAVLLVFSVRIFAVFAAGGLLYGGYVLLFLRQRRVIDTLRFQAQSRNHGLLIETIQGMAEIRLAGAERRFRWRWEREEAVLYKLQLRSLGIEQVQSGGGGLITEAKDIAITFLAASSVIAGEMTIGTLLAIQYLLGQLNRPLLQLVQVAQHLQDAKISLDRVQDVGRLAEDHGGVRVPIGGQTDIEFRSVSFRYGGPHNPPVFEDLDLVLPHGRVTALVGSSGSGKSTFLKLLLGIERPQVGTVAIGGVPLQSLSQRAWWDRCGVVLQEGRLFEGSLAENVALGDDAVDLGRLRRAIHLGCLDDVVASLPRGVETVLGEGGVGLSKGQAQRVLIARAIYKDPDVLLFDEATSALDASTEHELIQNLDAFYQSRTVLVIAHRLSTVRRADSIVVLEGGRVVEQGTHEGLVARRGRYFELVRQQIPDHA